MYLDKQQHGEQMVFDDFEISIIFVTIVWSYYVMINVLLIYQLIGLMNKRNIPLCFPNYFSNWIYWTSWIAIMLSHSIGKRRNCCLVHNINLEYFQIWEKFLNKITGLVVKDIEKSRRSNHTNNRNVYVWNS